MHPRIGGEECETATCDVGPSEQQWKQVSTEYGLNHCDIQTAVSYLAEVQYAVGERSPTTLQTYLKQRTDDSTSGLLDKHLGGRDRRVHGG